MRRIVLVASAHRSGAPRMARWLGCHPSALDVGNLPAFPGWMTHRDGGRCACGAAPFVACPFWGAVADRVLAETGWDPLADPHAHALELRGRSLLQRVRMRALRHLYLAAPGGAWPFRLLGGPRVLRDLVEATLRLYDAALDVAGAEVLVDHPWEPARVRALVAARPGTRVLHVVSDPQHPAPAARRFQDMLATLPRWSWMELHQDDLETEPEETLARACAFVDLTFHPQMLDPARISRHPVGVGAA